MVEQGFEPAFIQILSSFHYTHAASHNINTYQREQLTQDLQVTCDFELTSKCMFLHH